MEFQFTSAKVTTFTPQNLIKLAVAAAKKPSRKQAHNNIV